MNCELIREAIELLELLRETCRLMAKYNFIGDSSRSPSGWRCLVTHVKRQLSRMEDFEASINKLFS